MPKGDRLAQHGGAAVAEAREEHCDQSAAFSSVGYRLSSTMIGYDHSLTETAGNVLSIHSAAR
jgi:hypothetical protein